MNEAKNLACPFCGGQARVISRGYQDGGKWTDWVSVTCPATEGGCGASQAATTESEAWNNWNRRAGGRQPTTSETAGTKHVGISDLLASIVKIEKEVAKAEKRTAFGCMMDAKKGRKHLAWLEILRRITGARKQLGEMLANDRS